jgi:hypothetical protein
MLNKLPLHARRRCRDGARPMMPNLLYPLFQNPVHASQRLLNLGTIGDLPGVEFVPAQPTSQICPKVKLPQPDLEHLLAAGKRCRIADCLTSTNSPGCCLWVIRGNCRRPGKVRYSPLQRTFDLLRRCAKMYGPAVRRKMMVAD